jgi:hypothetical protein
VPPLPGSKVVSRMYPALSRWAETA